MKCKIADRDKIIEDYVHGHLPEKEMDAFDLHCFDCDICFGELWFREAAAGLIKESGPVIFADYLQKRKTSRRSVLRSIFQQLDKLPKKSHFRWAFAGMGAAIILIFLVVYQFDRRSVDNGAAFQTLPYLEEMLSDVSRSETVTVLSPEIGQKYKDGLSFIWEGTGDETVYVKILNNQGDELYSLATQGRKLQFNEKLSAGLYYWKLESEDDLLFVGKFLVEN